MSNTQTPLPCARCKSTDLTPLQSNGKWVVFCKSCWKTSNEYATLDVAVIDWNRRRVD